MAPCSVARRTTETGRRVARAGSREGAGSAHGPRGLGRARRALCFGPSSCAYAPHNPLWWEDPQAILEADVDLSM